LPARAVGFPEGHPRPQYRTDLGFAAEPEHAPHCTSSRSPGSGLPLLTKPTVVGTVRDPRLATPSDEQQASAGARSAPASLLHPWKAVATGSLSPSMQLGRAGGRRPCPRRAPSFVHASERRRVQASDARPDELTQPCSASGSLSHPSRSGRLGSTPRRVSGSAVSDAYDTSGITSGARVPSGFQRGSATRAPRRPLPPWARERKRDRAHPADPCLD
jgi:hypothetical protein